MRKILPLGLSLLLAVAIGCGGNQTQLNTAPLTEEQKRQIAEEDKKIDDEESPGNRTLNPKGKRK
ncbi:MAG: hypothetical protein L0241_28130 [Planctomycetia bacterium]|nr:hypothetical protein [Planctomycetia bacterium]